MSVQTNTVVKGWENTNSPLGNQPPASLLGSITWLCSLSRPIFINFMCRGWFSFNTSGVKSNLSIDNSARILVFDETQTLPACLSDIIMKRTVSVTNVWIVFGCNHSCLDETWWKEEREDKGVICVSRVSLSQGGRPYQRLEICCCDCDIISCPTPACQDQGPWLVI